MHDFEKQPTDMPRKYFLGEFSLAELRSGSGIFNESAGREDTVLEALDFIERATGGQGIYTSWEGDDLSEAARKHNTELARSSSGRRVRAGEYMVAVFSKRPPVDSEALPLASVSVLPDNREPVNIEDQPAA